MSFVNICSFDRFTHMKKNMWVPILKNTNIILSLIYEKKK